MNENRPKAAMRSDELDVCEILVDARQEYQEDVVEGNVSYETFVVNFIASRSHILRDKAGPYAKALQILTCYPDQVRRSFRCSFFTVREAMLLLDRIYGNNSRKEIDRQLVPVLERYRKEGMLADLTRCVNDILIFEIRLTESDILAILSGRSTREYALRSVSFFAFFMKSLEERGLTIRYWQSMVVRYSRLVYNGHPLERRTISSTLHSLGFQRRQLWQYDEIERLVERLPE